VSETRERAKGRVLLQWRRVVRVAMEGVMPESVLRSQVEVGGSLDDVFAFFADAANLEEITPGWLNFRIRSPLPIQMGVGALIDYRIRIRGVPVAWRTQIAAWEPPFRFVDEQLKGPYTLWEHEHTFEPTEGGVLVKDNVRYRVPGGPAAGLVERLWVKPDLERIFAYRREAMLRRFGMPGPGGRHSKALGAAMARL